MLTSWHNFFFAAFDPGGFVTVDKPPLGFGVQALSATIFGFSGWSLLLTQALAGLLSVVLLYHLVARVFGAWAGVVVVLALILLRILSAVISLHVLVATVGLLILLVAPTLWSLTPLMNADAALPFAGPGLATRPARAANLPQDTRIIVYLNANRGGARFLVATPQLYDCARR